MLAAYTLLLAAEVSFSSELQNRLAEDISRIFLSAEISNIS
jgi:hypothetical protein